MKLPEKVNSHKLLYSGIAFLTIAIITLGSSFYSAKVMNATELVHFWVPVPAGVVTKPMTIQTKGGMPVFTKPLTIRVDEQGILKQLLNPGVVGVSTHWIVNTDSRPRRIGLKLSEGGVPVRWEVGAGIPWDPESRTFLKPVNPGAQIPDLGIDWFFYVSEEVRAKPVWYDGGLTVFDADTSETLTFIPIIFRNGGG